MVREKSSDSHFKNGTNINKSSPTYIGSSNISALLTDRSSERNEKR